jgi:hypothetical protein
MDLYKHLSTIHFFSDYYNIDGTFYNCYLYAFFIDGMFVWTKNSQNTRQKSGFLTCCSLVSLMQNETRQVATVVFGYFAKDVIPLFYDWEDL